MSKPRRAHLQQDLLDPEAETVLRQLGTWVKGLKFVKHGDLYHCTEDPQIIEKEPWIRKLLEIMKIKHKVLVRIIRVTEKTTLHVTGAPLVLVPIDDNKGTARISGQAFQLQYTTHIDSAVEVTSPVEFLCIEDL